MILAIYGRSAVGKTTVAEIIGTRLQVPVRHCGIALRAAVSEAGGTIAEADATVHARVDRETIEWCERQGRMGGIVEGRFLDHVLAGRASTFLIVAMTASAKERAARLKGRQTQGLGPVDIASIDDAEDLFRLNMYGVTPKAPPTLTIDTTKGTASEWAAELERHLREHLNRAPG